MGERLRQIRYDENVAISHQDARRIIYEPNRIFENLDGLFCQHNVIVLSQNGLELGNHYHDYKELFFTPTGEFDFKLIDIDDFAMTRFLLKPGDRLLIPEGIGHVVTGKKGNVLMGYGNVRFNPKRLVALPKKALESLAQMK